MPNRAQGGAVEYREAMLRGASLAWEERWEAAAAAYRRALAARQGDPAAERQLALALKHAADREHRATAPAAIPTLEPLGARLSSARHNESLAPANTTGDILGRTTGAHLAELSELPRQIVRSVVESLQAIERDQAAGRYNAAFEGAFTLLERVPTFLPLHILLAELYTETGQWQAAHDKIEAVEATYAGRATDKGAEAAA